MIFIKGNTTRIWGIISSHCGVMNGKNVTYTLSYVKIGQSSVKMRQ
jgi:hypothetical protein